MFTFDKANRRARNMSEMMDRLGLDADRVCDDWLARAAKPVAKAPAFCPNAMLFEQARAEQVGS